MPHQRRYGWLRSSGVSARPRVASPRMRERIVTGVVASCVVALAVVDGGYFPTSWGVLLLAFGLAALIAAIVSDALAIGRLEIAFLAGLAGLAAWQLTSILWSDGADAPVLEAERTLAYVIAVAALFLWVRRSNVDASFAGLGAGVVIAALVGLVQHLAIGAPTVTRLAEPIGYANADGLLAGSGLIFALAVASRGRILTRGLAAASSVPLTAGLFLTLSRGAILATGLGIVFMLAVDRRRLEAVATAVIVSPAVVAGIALVSRSPVSGDGSNLDASGSAGRVLLAELAALAFVGAVGAIALTKAERAFAFPALWRRRAEVGLGLGCVLAVAVGLVAAGGPAKAARDVVDSFAASAPDPEGRSSARLTSASGSFRAEYWQVAWSAVGREPIHGTGAGSFERWWLEDRSIDQNVRDAHNLYLEVFAELGMIGLVVLGVTFLIPLVAVARARNRPLAAAAAGAFVAYLAHASLDWDWEIPALTIVALAAGALLLVAARAAGDRPVSATIRAALVCALVPVLLLAVVAHAGQWRLEHARRSLEQGNLTRAAGEALAARRWLPWAAEPWQIRGEALLAAGDPVEAARALRRASRMNRANWEVWYDLALVEQGAAGAAARERAAALNPRSPEVSSLEVP